MTLKKILNNADAQATVEYIMVFLAIVASLLVLLGGINQDAPGIKRIFGIGSTSNDLISRVRNQLNDPNY